MQWLPSRLPFSPRERWVLGVALVLVSVVHVASFLFFSNLSAANPQAQPYPIVSGDSFYYAHVASMILTYGVHADALPNLKLTNANLPGYPFLLAATKMLTGSFTPLVFVQFALLLLAVILIFTIGRRVMPWQLALVPALCFALEPMVVYTTSSLLTDSLFSSLLVVTVYIGFMQERIAGWRRAVALGLLLGLLAMIRPTGVVLIPLVGAFYGVHVWLMASHQRMRSAATALLVLLACVATLTVPWVIRNQVQLGRAELFHAGVRAFIDYNVRYFLAWRELGKEGPVSVYYPARHLADPVFEVVDTDIRQSLTAMTPAGQDSEPYVGQLVRRYISEDPIRYTYFHTAHLPAFFLGSDIGLYRQAIDQYSGRSGGGRSTMYETLEAIKNIRHPETALPALARSAPIVLEVVWWALVCALALVGLYAERKRLEVWLYASMSLYFGLAAGAVTVARYRISAEPFLLLLAAYGAYAIGSRAYAAYHAGKLAGERVPGWARLMELVRYVISGVSALLFSVVTYTILVFGFGVPYLPASLIGFLGAFIISFVLQKFFAFRDQEGPGRGGQIGKYLLLLLVNISANTLMLMFFVGYIGMDRFLGLFWANALVAIWNFFIYEKILFTERELHELPLPKQLVGDLADLSIVIPCHNEEGAIGAVLDSIPHGVGEIIVVDNNCTDRTAEIARSRGVVVIAETVPGTGAAMRAGFRRATKPIVAVIDGDNQHPAGELPRILHQLESEKLDFISAARFPLSDNWLRAFGNWGLTLVVNMLFGLPLTDSQSGMVMFRKKLLPGIDPKSDSFVFVQELKIRAAIAPRARFAESRIPCIAREHGQSKLLPIRHGVRILWSLVVLRATLGRER